MSAAKTDKETSSKQPDYKISGGLWASAWKIAAGLGAVGLAGSAAGFASDPKRFAFSYLFAFTFFLTIAIGSMFFVLIQRLSSAAWSVTVRRTAEFFMAGVPALALLFIPLLFVMGHLFPWMHETPAAGHDQAATAEHAGEHGAAHATEHGDHTTGEHASAHAGVRPIRMNWDEEYEHIEHHEHSQVLAHKRPYLNVPFFLIRIGIYFAAWIFISMRLFGLSTKQDGSKDPKLTVTAQRFSPVALMATVLTFTFAAFDWLMSLNPYWFSTIFGVWIFAGSILVAHAVITLVTLSLRSNGFIGNAVTVEHYHDLGKLTFGFTVFWAYIGFSQFFLIWYASIPEETVFFHQRWGDGPWKTVSMIILGVHFVFPFLLMMSRNIKRRPAILAIGVGVLVIMHMVEIYWIVMPNYVPRAGMEPGDALQIHWLDVASLVGIGGVYLAWVFRQMTQHKLIPVGDPRLARSLAFENA